ncbi:MAG: peptidase M4, partial [Staphylococcus epidermidis]|nr:peptidase M4 [Staphylococcus epidermidis]
MKLKKIFFAITILGGIVVFTGCGIGKDEVTNTDYKVNVENATNIYKANTNNSEILSVNFDIGESSKEYEYIFINSDEKIYINPQNEKVKKESDTSGRENNKEKFNVREIQGIKSTKKVLEEAKNKIGGISPRVLDWRLEKKDGTLVYDINVKTNTGSE